MAKKNETALAVATQETSNALATAEDFGGGLTVEGRDDTGPSLSRVAMFAGTAEEEANYGGHKRGVFLDTLEHRELGDKINIVPVVAYATYAQWESGQKQPVQTWASRAEVPPEMLKWGQDAAGNSVKPAVQESVNVICVVQGTGDGDAKTEPWPYLFVFKSTGLKAFESQINPIEARRAAIGKARGLYQLYSVDDKNPAGQPFKRLMARPLGDAPADMIAIAKAVKLNHDKYRAAADEMQAEDADFNPDAH